MFINSNGKRFNTSMLVAELKELLVDEDGAPLPGYDNIQVLLDKINELKTSSLKEVLENRWCGALSYLIVQDIDLWKILSRDAKKLLISAGISYMPEVYLDKERAEKATNKRGDNFLHVMGRAGNVDALLSIYEQDRIFMFDHIGMSNIDKHNSLHELALSGFSHTQIGSSKKFFTKLYIVIYRICNDPTKIEEEKREIKEILKDALNAQNKKGYSPLFFLGNAPESDRVEIEKLCGMQTLFTRVSNFLHDVAIQWYGKEKDVSKNN